MLFFGLDYKSTQLEINDCWVGWKLMIQFIFENYEIATSKPSFHFIEGVLTLLMGR